MAATVDESTPPDIATAMVWFSWFKSNYPISFEVSASNGNPTLRSRFGGFPINRAQVSQPRYYLWNQLQREVDVLSSVLLTKTETQARSRAVRRQPHRGQNVRRLNGSRRTRRSGRN